MTKIHYSLKTGDPFLCGRPNVPTRNTTPLMERVSCPECFRLLDEQLRAASPFKQGVRVRHTEGKPFAGPVIGWDSDYGLVIVQVGDKRHHISPAFLEVVK